MISMEGYLKIVMRERENVLFLHKQYSVWYSILRGDLEIQEMFSRE